MGVPGSDQKGEVTVYFKWPLGQVWLYNYDPICCGCDHMVVGFATTYAISTYHNWCCEVYNKHYVIKFVGDMRQVCGFLRVLQFPPPIKLTATT